MPPVTPRAIKHDSVSRRSSVVTSQSLTLTGSIFSTLPSRDFLLRDA